MSKTCMTCKHGEKDFYDEPCFSCCGFQYYTPISEKDDKQIYCELLTMYITELDLAMGNDYNECDTIMRDVKKDKFMQLLGEFKTAIIIDLQGREEE